MYLNYRVFKKPFERKDIMSTRVISEKDVRKDWKIIDAAGKVLGKVASNAAHYLRGKHKPAYSPHLDDGDYVVIVNASKVRLTGKKASQKKYYHHTGYTGHLKEITYKDLLHKKPEFVIRKAVKGMLSNNRLGRAQFKHLRVYAESNHRHEAQHPQEVELK